MKRKNQSLRERAEVAERRAKHALQKMKDMDMDRRRANAISDGSQLWVTALASMIGRSVTISAEQFEKAKKLHYMVRRLDNGDLQMVLEEDLREGSGSDAPDAEKAVHPAP